MRGLQHGELQELGLLYRQTASDLAIVREDNTSNQLAAYLNSLLGRAHNLIYMGHRPKISELTNFYSRTYPRVFRETLPQTMLAFGIFVVSAVAAFALTVHDPSFAHRMLGAQMMDTIEKHEMWTHSIVTVKPLAASAIMTNNLSVAFTTFALGITLGVGTAWMMVVNGLLLGVVGAGLAVPGYRSCGQNVAKARAGRVSPSRFRLATTRKRDLCHENLRGRQGKISSVPARFLAAAGWPRVWAPTASLR